MLWSNISLSIFFHFSLLIVTSMLIGPILRTSQNEVQQIRPKQLWIEIDSVYQPQVSLNRFPEFSERILPALPSQLNSAKSKKDLPSKLPDETLGRLRSSYLSKIRNKIESYVKYPKFLQKLRQEGAVELRATIDIKGSVEKLEVLKSSGFPRLDRLALDAVEKAQPFEKPGSRTTFTLPVHFKLQ